MKGFSTIFTSAAVFIFLCLGAFWVVVYKPKAEKENYVVIVEPDSIYRLTQQGSRPKQEYSSLWVLKPSDVEKLESNLYILNHKIFNGYHGESKLYAKVEKYFRQYVGIVVNGQRSIYINALYNDADLQKYIAEVGESFPMVVSDGGDYFWGALYNPEANEFSNLYVNGDN